MKIAAMLLGAVLALSSGSAAGAAGVRVVDGDTLQIDGTIYRIHGIDAPEAGQKCARAGGGTWDCGKRAIAEMQGAVAAGDVTCEPKGHDAYGRTLAICRVAGLDLGRLMVKEGLAWSFRRYSPDYNETEDQARAAHIGIWEAQTEPAWAYREHRWDVAKQAAPKGCPIKGNINSKGERIYHAPWSPWYAKTKITAAHGERWFCSEGEAIAAGWRAPLWGK